MRPLPLVGFTATSSQTTGSGQVLPSICLPYLVMHQSVLFLLPGLEEQEGVEPKRKCGGVKSRGLARASDSSLLHTLPLHPTLSLPIQGVGGGTIGEGKCESTGNRLLPICDLRRMLETAA